MAALTVENFAALQSLLKASSKDVVRQLCQESFSSSAVGSKKLLDMTCSSLSVTQEEAEQLLRALHRLTRLAVFRDLSSAEAILALFPENFHQNLKNLLTKIILEHISTWRTEAQANQISLPRLVDLDWRVDIKTSSDSISRMAVPTCLLQMKKQITLTRSCNIYSAPRWSPMYPGSLCVEQQCGPPSAFSLDGPESGARGVSEPRLLRYSPSAPLMDGNFPEPLGIPCAKQLQG
ncbi:COMM domain-containing protein 9 isoform X1 [Lynx canadensis]|uniref:COMM domain-containing protein 9 isoform X1 n=1 Tax=Lynx canadensis TaxID=61383 RepID=UPI0011B09F5B|nr:COMM domain-containing protein 9 isoform X1 [Lynx canadensis]